MNRLKELRKERGLTLQELSDILLDDYDIKTYFFSLMPTFFIPLNMV